MEMEMERDGDGVKLREDGDTDIRNVLYKIKEGIAGSKQAMWIEFAA